MVVSKLYDDTISSPEAAILLVSTKDTSVSRSLDKGNAGSGYEIDEDTKMQTNATQAHFSHVSCGEFRNFVKVCIVHDIDAYITI